MLAGTAQVDITPDIPYPRGGGYFKLDKVCNELLDPLYASSIALRDGDTTCLLISCDLGMFSNELAAELRARIETATGVNQRHILLSVSHGHQMPRFAAGLPMPWLQTESDNPREHPSLRKEATGKIVQSAQLAMERLQPARMGHGKRRVKDCAYNRRFIMNNGRVNPFNHHGGKLTRIAPEGPVDDELQIVWLENLQGEYLTVMVNFASHGTALYGTDYASADYPGAVRNVIQSVLGKDVPVWFTQGACGNVETKDHEGKRRDGGKGLAAYYRLGRTIGGAALQIISERDASDQGLDLQFASTILDIPYRELSEEEGQKAEQTWAAYTPEEKMGYELQKTVYDVWGTLDIYHAKQAYPFERVEINLVRIGDVYITANPCEMFVEYQLELKKKFSGKNVIMVSLTNGMRGYVPTLLAFALGGYESFETRRFYAGRLAPEAGGMMMDEMSRLIEEMENK